MFDYSNTAQAVKERTLIKNVYMWMAAGLALTGLTSMWMASDPARVQQMVQGGTMWVFLIAELVLVFYLSARLLSMKPLTATLCFAGYSILNGLTLSVIFFAYTMESITSTFFICFINVWSDFVFINFSIGESDKVDI